MPEHKIEINDLKVYAYHGCLEEEGKIGGNYLVDLVIYTDFTKATQTDDLEDTVCYTDVSKIVYEEMGIRSKLIEHVAQRILVRVKALNGVNKCRVKLTKIAPPIAGDVGNVAVIVEE